MGIFSEIDMENKMRKEQGEEQAMTASELAAQRDEARQAAEAAEAQKLLAELNEATASPSEDDEEPAEEEGNSPAETIGPPSEDEKRKAHEEYLESQRKYIKGEPITSLEEFDKYNGWVIWGERTTHVSVIKNLPFHLASRSIRHGGIRKAIQKESE